MAARKLKSSGGSETLLSSVIEPEQLPFCGGSDGNQHNTKAYLRDARGNDILINGTTIRFDETTTSLRGPVAVENSDDLWSRPRAMYLRATMEASGLRRYWALKERNHGTAHSANS